MAEHKDDGEEIQVVSATLHIEGQKEVKLLKNTQVTVDI